MLPREARACLSRMLAQRGHSSSRTARSLRALSGIGSSACSTPGTCGSRWDSIAASASPLEPARCRQSAFLASLNPETLKPKTGHSQTLNPRA